ncbi:MAG: glycosyltransferase family protein [Elusimicrobia bacterium]|nr:glycosyltransferase family protein [Elusimicrobiota bacterium]
MDVLAIIQARLGSTRLPRKVLLPLEDKAVLEHVAERVGRSRKVSGVLIATTVAAADAELAAFCSAKGLRCFRGSERDVLDRFRQAAASLRPAHVVRVTADCPLIDPDVLDLVVSRHLESKADYTANVLEETFPDGLDAEAFTMPALERAWREAKLPSEREHVTTYVRGHPELFRLAGVTHEPDLSRHRWTLDRPEDYEFLKAVYKALYKPGQAFGLKEVLTFLEAHPELETINSGIRRNEGLLKSLEEDRRHRKEGGS